MVLSINECCLSDLPSWVRWQAPIGLGSIGFPDKDWGDAAVLLIWDLMLVMRSESVLTLMKPPSAGMSELSDFDPTLWLLISHSFEDPFLGAKKIGCTIIPGSNLAPKASE